MSQASLGATGKVAALPKLVIVHAVIWESLRGLNLSRVFLKQTPVALEHLTLLSLGGESRADFSVTELFIGLLRSGSGGKHTCSGGIISDWSKEEKRAQSSQIAGC